MADRANGKQVIVIIRDFKFETSAATDFYAVYQRFSFPTIFI
jgi:hypothetical protein